MKFKVGDKVRFLNQSGGGIVTKIISPQLVSVAIEEGFEIPTLTSELISIETQDAGSKFFNKESLASLANINADVKKSHSTPTKMEDEDTPEKVFTIRKGKGMEAETIWLVFIPHDQKWLITGLLDICLLNPTDYDVLYSYLIYQPDHRWRGADYDVLPPVSGITLATVHRDELHDWLEGSVQMLFQQEMQPRLPMPVNAPFRLKPARFQKEDNYIDNAFIDDKALLVNLATIQSVGALPEALEGSDLPVESKVKTEVPKALIDKHRTAPFEAEVDLHISALQDNYSNLGNHEILKIQTDYFQRCLESALEAQYRKIIFIHGIGNGTLRNAILEQLKAYEELQVQNAPFRKYGYGAIEVVNGKQD